VRRDFVKYAHLTAMQEKIRDAAIFFEKMQGMYSATLTRTGRAVLPAP
jgi:hypothetical protein